MRAALAGCCVQDTSNRFDYDGHWELTRRGEALGGSTSWTFNDGDTATLEFNGHRVALIAPTGPELGAVEIYEGNDLLETVDLASADVTNGHVVWTHAWDDRSARRLRVVALTGNGGQRVELDAIAVLE